MKLLSRKTLFHVLYGLLLAAGLSLTALPTRAETVIVYSYYNFPPFFLEKGKGLSNDFVEFLNRKYKGKPQFQLEVVPRGRLNKLMEEPDFKDTVAWVSPGFFNTEVAKSYLWSKPLIEDANVVLSNVNSKIEYAAPVSLQGKRLGGVIGHSYAGIDDLVKAGTIKREDVPNERNNLLKLAEGRIDATLLPRSTSNYLLHDMALTDKIYIAPIPHSSYTRQVLVAGTRAEVQKLIDAALVDMAKDSAWQATLAKYKIK
jgi:polar amino acid transport system substrate-binding protein